MSIQSTLQGQACRQLAVCMISVLCRTRTRPAHEHGMLVACLMSYRALVCPLISIAQPCASGIHPTVYRKAAAVPTPTIGRLFLSILGSACQLCVSSLCMSHWWTGADVHASLVRLDLCFFVLASVLHVGILGLCLRPLSLRPERSASLTSRGCAKSHQARTGA